MADPSTDGQDAAQEARILLARAARALVEEGSISTEGLLPAYRSAATPDLGHAGAGADAVDVAFVRRMRSLGGDALLRARTLVLDESAPPRAAARVVDNRLVVAASDGAAAHALHLALGLSLEAAKLAHGLKPDADALRAAFATPSEARAAVEALERGGAAREISVAPPREPRVDERALALHTAGGERPVYVVAGAGAWRVHDLVSPFARRLRSELFSVGQALAGAGAAAAVARDDEIYVACDALFADGAITAERIEAERGEGFLPAGPGALCVKCESMVDDVDRRCKESLVGLKRARALVLLVEAKASSLAAALRAAGPSCRAVVVLHESPEIDPVGAAGVPAWIRERAAGHLTAVQNAMEGAAGLAVDDEAFSLVQAVQSALALGVIAPAARLALRRVTRGDVAAMSRACIDVLARLGPKKGR